MGDGHTLPQGRTGSANQRPIRRSGWGQLVGEASGPRQLRKKPSRDPPFSPPYSRALRSTFIMADLFVDSHAPVRYVCALARAQPPPDVTVHPRPRRSSAAVRSRCRGGMEGSVTPSAAARTQRWAGGQPAKGEGRGHNRGYATGSQDEPGGDQTVVSHGVTAPLGGTKPWIPTASPRPCREDQPVVTHGVRTPDARPRPPDQGQARAYEG